MPLFKGRVDKQALISALKTNDPAMALKKDQSLSYLKPTSVFIRIHDNQVPIIPKNGDFSDLDTTLLPGNDLEQYFLKDSDVPNGKKSGDDSD